MRATSIGGVTFIFTGNFFGELRVPNFTQVVDQSPLTLYQRGAPRCLQMSRF